MNVSGKKIVIGDAKKKNGNCLCRLFVRSLKQCIKVKNERKRERGARCVQASSGRRLQEMMQR